MTVYIALDFSKQKILFASESRPELNRILLEEQAKTKIGQAVWLGKMTEETFLQISNRMLALMMRFRTSFSSLVKYHHRSIFIYGYTL
ncbi:hypothetical protein HAU32_10970 [Weissella confusa]|uniref:hypothetical protein n=1 Tax=Weissella TaxID=46255 RepID=UPI0018F1886C|nr:MULTISPECIES: hypothetical protein [Weissella]MBJ7689460.1 hypothetical protein [Weissella confusa]MCW0927899.1 hypothetical protein [Weissella sp. LMG 11983]